MKLFLLPVQCTSSNGGWQDPQCGLASPEFINPLVDIPSGCCSFTGRWTFTRSSLRTLRRVTAFCRPLRPVLLLVSFPRSRSPVVGVPELWWLRRMPTLQELQQKF